MTSKNTYPKNWQAYLSNYYTLERNYFYDKELSKLEHRKIIITSPFLCDSRRSFYFLAIVYLCNFLKKGSDLYLTELINTISNKDKKAHLKALFYTLETNRHYKNLFNLRDKYIGHRDNNRFTHDAAFPSDVFERFLRIVKRIIEESFKNHAIPFETRNYYDEQESITMLFDKLNK